AIAKQLPAEPGQRILGIAVVNERAVAVLETSASGAGANAPPPHRARWLTLGPELAWGAWIDAGNQVSPAISLSPSGKRLARVLDIPAKGLQQAGVVATAGGALVANEPAAGAQGVGLVDDDHLALGQQGGVTWLDLTKLKGPAPIPPPA